MDISTEIQSLETKGMRANGKRAFEVRFTGEEVYALLRVMEERAVACGNYLDVRQAVYFAERIREQVKEQGF